MPSYPHERSFEEFRLEFSYRVLGDLSVRTQFGRSTARTTRFSRGFPQLHRDHKSQTELLFSNFNADRWTRCFEVERGKLGRLRQLFRELRIQVVACVLHTLFISKSSVISLSLSLSLSLHLKLTLSLSLSLFLALIPKGGAGLHRRRARRP